MWWFKHMEKTEDSEMGDSEGRWDFPVTTLVQVEFVCRTCR